MNTTLFLHVFSDASRDGVAGDCFTGLACIEDERRTGVLFTDNFEEFDATLAGHIAIRDDTIEFGLSEPVDYEIAEGESLSIGRSSRTVCIETTSLNYCTENMADIPDGAPDDAKDLVREFY